MKRTCSREVFTTSVHLKKQYWSDRMMSWHLRRAQHKENAAHRYKATTTDDLTMSSSIPKINHVLTIQINIETTTNP